MAASAQQELRLMTVKILGKEYRLRSEVDPDHLNSVAEYVDRLLREVRIGAPDTQDAAILTALNIASDLLRERSGPMPLRERIQGLIELIDSV